MRDRVIEFLCELIAIDSVNPSLVRGAAGEREIADAVAAEMRRIGMDVEIDEVTAGRPNVVGVLEGRNPGRSLMMCGHLDTVGVERMSDPFKPVERNGRLYGRGSGDMKGGLAAMIEAARSIVESGGPKAGRLIVAAVVDEEYASIGAEALVRTWQANAAVVAEPTDLQVAIGHKGFSWLEVIVAGRAAHGSRPLEGRDAIIGMGRVLGRLEALDQSLQSRQPHPVLGTASLHASLIEGGRELSTYPDRCVLQLERRTVTGETGANALTEVVEILSSLRKQDVEFDGEVKLTFSRPPYETPADSDLPELLEKAMSSMGIPTQRSGMSYWTDAAILGEAGIPTVIFGPGGAGYHGLEEYVQVEEVIACRRALADLAGRFCA